MISALEMGGFASDVQVWHMDVCNSTCSCVWRAFFVCVSWLMHMCDMTHLCHCLCVWHKSWAPPIREWFAGVTLSYITWLIYMCHVTYASMSYHSFNCVTRLIQMCHMTQSCVSLDSFKCVTCLIHMCHVNITWLVHRYHMTHSYVSHELFICVTWLHSFASHDSTHSCVSCFVVWATTPIVASFRGGNPLLPSTRGSQF